MDFPVDQESPIPTFYRLLRHYSKCQEKCALSRGTNALSRDIKSKSNKINLVAYRNHVSALLRAAEQLCSSKLYGIENNS